MQIVIVNSFGGPEVLQLQQRPTPVPGPGQVLVRVTSIGMNHAELMARRGEYKITSGVPPFTPGLEAGGIVEAVGPNVNQPLVNDRVLISPEAPRIKNPDHPELCGGTYRSHYLCDASLAIPAPAQIPDDQLGAIWLAYLTAWGCLVTHQNIGPGTVVALPAASSSLALAAAQIVKHKGGVTIGMTSNASKVDAIRALPTAAFDHLVVTHDGGKMLPWPVELKKITQGKGVDVFFDPVASGEFLNSEIRSLAQAGVIWVYGLLGQAGVVDVQPLIRKGASIRGWMLSDFVAGGPTAYNAAVKDVLEGFASGAFKQHIAARYPLADVAAAHVAMEKGVHIGKLLLIP